MSEVMKRFYLIRYQQGKCTEETLNALVLSGKLTSEECASILGDADV